jgi:type IV pilus assembly protein PilC
MPVYTYTAKDLQGKYIKGELSSDSTQGVFAALKTQKLFPLSVEERKEKRTANKGNDILRKRVKKKHIAVFTRQFASMLQAGVPLPVILDVMIKQEQNSSFKEILIAVNGDVLSGSTLSDAMAKHRVFPQLLVCMVEVGEVNGRLDMSFESIAATLEKELKLAGKVKGAMIYPMVLLTVTVLVSILLAFVVLPVFKNMFEQMGVKLPPVTRAFINISDFMTSYWYIAGATILLVIFIMMKLMREPVFKKETDRLLLKLPVIGKLQNVILMARFCRTFSGLADAGVGVITALETVRNVITNSHIQSSFDEIMRDVQTGSTITLAVSRHRVFTPLVISMLRIGEESGRLGEVLSKTAEFYEDEADTQLQKATALMEPAVTVIMALGVGFVVFSIVQPMFQMYTIFGK